MYQQTYYTYIHKHYFQHHNAECLSGNEIDHKNTTKWAFWQVLHSLQWEGFSNYSQINSFFNLTAKEKQCCVLLAHCAGFHWSPVDSFIKIQWCGKSFHLMISSWLHCLSSAVVELSRANGYNKADSWQTLHSLPSKMRAVWQHFIGPFFCTLRWCPILIDVKHIHMYMMNSDINDKSVPGRTFPRRIINNQK